MDNIDISAVDIGTLAGLATLAAVLTVAVYLEILESRIPNWLTLSGMAAGLLIGFLPGGISLKSSLIGLLIGFGFLFIFFVFGGVGGGDVKLMGAAGALLGSDLTQRALFFTALAGAIMALVALVWSRNFWDGLERFAKGLRFWQQREPEDPVPKPAPVTVPYGVAIAVGCLATLYLK